MSLSVQVISVNIRGDFTLPLVSVVEELLLVVQQLFMCLGGELKVGAFHDCVYGTSFLAETAVNAFGHVNIVTGRSPRAVGTFLCLDGDSLSRTDGFTQLASNAALLPAGVPAQCVLPAEAGAQGPLLKWVVDGSGLFEDMSEHYGTAAEQLEPEDGGGRPVGNGLEAVV